MIGQHANRAAQIAAARGIPVSVSPDLGLLQAAMPRERAEVLHASPAPVAQRAQVAAPVTPAPDAKGRHAELLRIAKGINDITLLARVPTLLGASAYIEDPEERQDIINVLDVVQLASGAPLMGDKARAGAYTLKHSPDTRQALKHVGRDVGTEAALQSIPVLSAVLSSILQ